MMVYLEMLLKVSMLCLLHSVKLVVSCILYKYYCFCNSHTIYKGRRTRGHTSLPKYDHHNQSSAVTTKVRPSLPKCSHHYQSAAITTKVQPSLLKCRHHYQSTAITTKVRPSLPKYGHHYHSTAITT